jgi:DNA repair exonuclease SbcCD ATPase subunit
MIKKLLIGAVCLGMFSFAQTVNAQEKTKEELKAEREALKTEYKSQERQDRQKKLDELTAKPPKECGVASVDGLAKDSKTMLDEQKKINELLPDMYKRTVGETIDGVTTVVEKKPTVAEIVELSTKIANQSLAVADATKKISKATDDIKGLSPMKAPTATKSLNYSKDALNALASELSLETKIVANLLATAKSAGNL